MGVNAGHNFGRGVKALLSNFQGGAIDCMLTEFPSVGDEENL